MNEEKNENQTTKLTINDVLLEFSTTEYFKAIKWLTVETHKRLMEKLVPVDPNKEPTELARLQGEIRGIFYLVNHIEYIKQQLAEKKEDEKSR